MAKKGENVLARGWMLRQRGRNAGFACQPNLTLLKNVQRNKQGTFNAEKACAYSCIGS